MQDLVRVLRIIEYTGPRDEIEKLVAASIHGERKVYNASTIRAATLGSFPEILKREEDASE